MSSLQEPNGYQCEFIDVVSDNFYCSKCSLVARELRYTTCCGESYCHGCVADTQQKGEPCPACGEEKLAIMKPVKHLKQMEHLQVFCSMKERGCNWSGTLGELDTHLDPDQDNCQYVDTKCPLNCQQTIPKNEVEQHVAEECIKRELICQHCGFKATYEEVVNIHLPECKYVPLKCPNLCGVTCDREDMEDHMKMCRLEEVACEFGIVGCSENFRREDEEEHAKENVQKHIAMTALSGAKEREKLKEKLKIQEQELQNQRQKIQDQEDKLRELEQIVLELKKDLAVAPKLAVAKTRDALRRTFIMDDVSEQKSKSTTWNSPAMYTHVCGYKFGIRVYANGYPGFDSHNTALTVVLVVFPGEYDHQLKWPAYASISLELINQKGGENLISVGKIEWKKAPSVKLTFFFQPFPSFVEHGKLADYLCTDSLVFCITDVTLLG